MTSRSERGRDQGYCDHITYVDKVYQMLLHKKLSYFRGKTSLWSSRCIKAKKWRIMHHFESNLFLPNTWKLVLVLPNYFLILMDCCFLTRVDKWHKQRTAVDLYKYKTKWCIIFLVFLVFVLFSKLTILSSIYSQL